MMTFIKHNIYRAIGRIKWEGTLTLKGSFLCCLVISLFTGCNKLVDTGQPVSTITIAKTFANDVNSTSALMGIYSNMSEGGTFYQPSWSNSLTTICPGITADELTNFTYVFTDFQDYTVLAPNAVISGSFWGPAYYNIYQANALIENLQASAGVTSAVKKELTGEAKFIRAFCHFYLVNLFGDVPLVTKSAWYSIDSLSRTPTAQVYQQIVQDLKDAKAALPTDYSLASGEKIRANFWAASSLLARVYLYTGDWQDAETEADAVISSGNYQLLSDPNAVFLKNSDEAILQLQTLNDGSIFATQEGNNFIPSDNTQSAQFSLTDPLLKAFEPNDLRFTDWVDSTIYNGSAYYYPYKYKSRVSSQGNINEYCMLLRLAEQYLIRAEAKAHLGTDLAGAISDINKIRGRAKLTLLDPSSLNQSQVLAAVMQERRIELFAEWGHRWFDLKRTNTADVVLQSKAGWSPDFKLWPIPSVELSTDPFLTQNPGY